MMFYIGQMNTNLTCPSTKNTIYKMFISGREYLYVHLYIYYTNRDCSYGHLLQWRQHLFQPLYLGLF